MSTHRAHIAFPSELVAQIDEAVGPRKRSAFLIALAEKELKLIQFRAFVKEMATNPAWKDEDHPELAEGSGEWVRKLRAANEHRMVDAEARWSAE